MHRPEYYMGRIERMLDDLLDTQPHRDDLRQNIYDSYVNLAESRDGLLAACKAALELKRRVHGCSHADCLVCADNRAVFAAMEAAILKAEN